MNREEFIKAVHELALQSGLSAFVVGCCNEDGIGTGIHGGYMEVSYILASLNSNLFTKMAESGNYYIADIEGGDTAKNVTGQLQP